MGAVRWFPFLIRVLVAAVVIITATFHVIRPDVDPVMRGVSRYQWGAYGTLMSLAFVLLGLALAAAAQVARQWAFARAPLVATLLSLSAAGSLVVSAFPLSDNPPTANIIMHQSGGAVMFATFAMGTLLVPAGVAGRHWSLVGRLTVVIAVAFGAAIVLRLPISGLLQRLLLATMCTWLAGVARSAIIRPDATSR
jgi:hypothetical protein